MRIQQYDIRSVKKYFQDSFIAGTGLSNDGESRILLN
jgi:hypothetical protein